uniref:Uncharacterized protein n=1 Tax=Macrostomum lignano TaxID=282301 RepID=A0A1I8I8F5_9PLAT
MLQLLVLLPEHLVMANAACCAIWGLTELLAAKFGLGECGGRVAFLLLLALLEHPQRVGHEWLNMRTDAAAAAAAAVVLLLLFERLCRICRRRFRRIELRHFARINPQSQILRQCASSARRRLAQSPWPPPVRSDQTVRQKFSNNEKRCPSAAGPGTKTKAQSNPIEMDGDEFRQRGRQMVDLIVDYVNSFRDRPVVPNEGESFDKILADIEPVVLAGVIGDQAPSYRTVARWIEAFGAGRSSLCDDPRSGRPSTAVTKSNIDAVQSLVAEDPNISVAMLSQTLDISEAGGGSVFTILHEQLGLRKITARWVPHQLTEEQRQERVRCSQEFLRLCASVLAAPSASLTLSPVPNKSQNKVWTGADEERPTVLRSGFRSRKQMFVVFFSICGPVAVVMPK